MCVFVNEFLDIWLLSRKRLKGRLATSSMSKTKLFWYVPYDLNEMSHYFHYR